MKLGIFGGTFDPPHVGHLAVARAARDALARDRGDLMPLHLPPHRGGPAASAEDRLAMVTLICEGEDRLAPSALEILRGGVSFTVDTLAELAAAGADDLFLIIGADSYDELPTWRATARVQQLAHLVLLPRPGASGAAQLRPEDEARLRSPGQPAPPGEKAVYAIPMAPVPVAARDIREQLARGEDPGPALPRPVFEYIRRRGLYGFSKGAPPRG